MSNLSNITDDDLLDGNTYISTGTAYQLQEKIGSLQQALLTAHPTMPVLLREIHKQLRADPELVTVLTDDEIGILVNGLKKQVGVELVTTAPKAVTANAALKKQLKAAGGSAADLF